MCLSIDTVCPRSLDPFYIETLLYIMYEDFLTSKTIHLFIRPTRTCFQYTGYVREVGEQDVNIGGVHGDLIRRFIRKSYKEYGFVYRAIFV